jgi:hemerythrin-like domain-containing protein
MREDGAKPDLIFVKLVHLSLRIDVDRLVDSVAALDVKDPRCRIQAIRAFFDQYRDQLLLHHSHEDELFFPAVEARVGAEGIRLGELIHQHEALDAALQGTSHGLSALADSGGDFARGRTRACDALSAMNETLATHLDLEEATILPFVESEISVADYKELETQTRHATPRARAQFLIPWILAHATPTQRKALFRSAPPLRLVNLVMCRRYRRFDHALVRTA